MLKRICLALGTALCLALLCGNVSAKDEKPVLRIGCEGAFAPFTFIDDKGEITGFDIDLIRELGEGLGYEVKITVYPFDGLIPALMADNIDAIISGFTISPERAQKVDFSEPYFLCGLNFLIRGEDETKYRDLDSLKGQKICLQIGTTGSLFAQKQLTGSELKQFNSPPETYLELLNRGCSAVINDSSVNDFFLARHKGEKVVAVPIDKNIDKEYYGIAVNKNHPEMLDTINRGLKQVRANGVFKRISEQWFGHDISSTLEE